MAATKAKKRKAKVPSNVIVGMYPPKKRVTIHDYIKAYGWKVSEVRKVAKEMGIKLCLNGH
jgi:hypothetical protein